MLRDWGLYKHFPACAKGSRLVNTAELDPARRYVLGLHPHGVMGNASVVALGTDGMGFSTAFPGIRLSQAILDFIFMTPGAREISLLHGWCGVSRDILLARLAGGPGSAVCIVVGGAAEAVLAEASALCRRMQHQFCWTFRCPACHAPPCPAAARHHGPCAERRKRAGCGVVQGGLPSPP